MKNVKRESRNRALYRRVDHVTPASDFLLKEKRGRAYPTNTVSATMSFAEVVLRLCDSDATLTTLDLNRQKIGDEGARELAERLKKSTTLTTLHLYGNQIGAEGAKELAEALKMNSTLTTLNLSHNQIGDEGAKELAEALKRNTALATLNLNGNGIGAEGAKELAEALKFNISLTTMDLSDNGIVGARCEELSILLERNKAIVRAVRSAVCFVIGIRRGNNCKGMGDFGRFPRDVVLMIAKRLWATRGDVKWLEVA